VTSRASPELPEIDQESSQYFFKESHVFRLSITKSVDIREFKR